MRFFYTTRMTIQELYPIFKKFPKAITDSRKVQQGSIFFALQGEHFNGNRFAAEALKQGAEYAIVDDQAYCLSKKTILVDNVLETLQQLAAFHRKKLKIPVLGITGSNGKTTTKELVSAVLSQKYQVTSTQGNLNNHIGVPLTILSMNKDTTFGVVEMGANHPGEIAPLCSIADPDYGIITNIGRAHLEGFGSVEAIIRTKAELYDHLKKKNGTVFYNRDNPILSGLITGISNTISYGQKDADLTGRPVVSPPYIHAKVNYPKGVLYLNSRLTGSYNFENIMAAACIGQSFDVDPLLVQQAISNYRPSNSRSQLIDKNNKKIIIDTYNANTTSMNGSIESFSAFSYHPKYLILGDMLELGAESLHEHTAVVEQIKKHPFTEVFLVGPFFEEAAQNSRFKCFSTTKSLCIYLDENPLSKGAVLIKGSRGIQLEKVLETL